MHLCGKLDVSDETEIKLLPVSNNSKMMIMMIIVKVTKSGRVIMSILIMMHSNKSNDSHNVHPREKPLVR